jgi:hypothetical protein
MLNAIAHVNLRQRAMEWALASSDPDEKPEAVIARAEAYLAYVLYPVRPDVVEAMNERLKSTVQ